MRGGADPADPLDVDLPGQGRLHGAGRVGTAALVGVAVAVALGGWTGGVAGAAALTPAGAPGGCDTPVLDRPRHSADAIGGLGASIRSVAARSGTTAATLSRRLRADPTLWVNTCGLLYFADALPGDLPGTTGDGASWPATIDPADAFTLHSRPGADRVIYLDFDGQVITGTVWNSDYATASWAAPAFSTDADASTFSSAERTAIVEVWQRVAQDFAPFAVDVTTQEPAADAITRSSSTDTRFGTRVLISPDDSQSECGCAGVAYLDAFDRTSNHAYLQPAWVYPDAVSNQARHIAEAVSHETGHTFGLLHDGTQTADYYGGAGGWGPIMGAPYGQAVTQWSDGSYPGADNTEDDLAIIAANGAPWLTDDAGDVASSALPLALDASRIGLLNTTADLDTYSVTVGAGLLTATAEPSWPGPNVDLSVTLRDSAGTVLASAAPAFSASQVRTSLSAAVSLVVPAGTYTVEVEGVGNGNPGSAGASDYGSVGWYSVVASGIAPTTSTPTPTPTATLTATQTNPTSPGPTPTTSAPAPPGGSSSSPPTTSESPPSTESPGSPAGPTVAVAVRALGVESRTLPAAKKRVSYRTTLVAAGGSGGYTWKRTKGKLPKGLKLSRAGVLSGKAATKVSARFRVRVTDSSGARSTAWVRLRVR